MNERIICNKSVSKKRIQKLEARDLLEGIYIEKDNLAERLLTGSNTFFIDKIAQFTNQPA